MKCCLPAGSSYEVNFGTSSAVGDLSPCLPNNVIFSNVTSTQITTTYTAIPWTIIQGNDGRLSILNNPDITVNNVLVDIGAWTGCISSNKFLNTFQVTYVVDPHLELWTIDLQVCTDCATTNVVLPRLGPPPVVSGRIYVIENICQADFVIEYNNNCIEHYTKYNIPVQLVLKGEGYTLVEKANSLGVDLITIVRYSMLRYVLSKVFFGCFNVKYLRQKYYKQFLACLEDGWSKYTPYFDNSLWLHFKK